ncbi:G-protein coupled receptor 52-like [Lampetra fluviatilis]
MASSAASSAAASSAPGSSGGFSSWEGGNGSSPWGGGVSASGSGANGSGTGGVGGVGSGGGGVGGGERHHQPCPLGLSQRYAGDVCVLEAAVLTLLTALIVAGNLTVIFVFHCAPLLHHHTTSYFIRTMAYADLSVGLSCLVPTLSLLHYGPPWGLSERLACKAFGYVVSVLKSVSVACLACISLDRYLAVTRPLSYGRLVTPCRVRCSVAAVCLYSCAVFAPSFFGWGKPGYHGDVFGWCARSWRTNAAYTAFVVCALYAPAASVVCFTYARIFRICRQHTRQIRERRARFPNRDADAGGGDDADGDDGRRGAPGPCGGGSGRSAASSAGAANSAPDRRYATVLFRITSVFYALWLPYIAYLLLESARLVDSAPVSFLTTWLAISNSFCNCLVYSLSTSGFRLGLRRLSGAVCAACAASGRAARGPSLAGSTAGGQNGAPFRAVAGTGAGEGLGLGLGLGGDPCDI